MDFEERLARIIERHEALAAYFELSTHEWNQRSREFDKRMRAFDKRMRASDERMRASDERMKALDHSLELQTANIDRLVALAESHENRLHKLESST